MLVLGVGGYMHDYNCCLIDTERKTIAMCEAERLSRRKHHTIEDDEDLLAPIQKCCRDLGRKLQEIDVVVHGHTDDFDCKQQIEKVVPAKKYVSIDHHLCHAAASFFSSPFESAAIVSLDGFGDGSSGLLASGKGSKIEEFQRIKEEDSIGLEYLRATIHIGLGGYGSEGKTQGLAAYGKPTLYEQYMNEMEVLASGDMRLSKKLRTEGSRLAEEGGYLNTQLLNNAFLNTYSPKRLAHEPMTAVHNDLAASIQKVLEQVAIKLCQITKQKTGQENLVLGGGVSMNSSMNGYLLGSNLFKRIFALPMASDRGIGFGAALYYIHHVEGLPRFVELNHVFFGDEFDDATALKAMKKAGLRCGKSDDVVGEAAKILSEGKIVGWFQGRSELGARALGNRSILADPRVASMKDTVNSRVKHREWFRPFAPAVLDERAHEYFDFPKGAANLSFMTFTVPANDAAAKAIPAVVHVDRTARIQTVYAKHNPPYAKVIEAFGKLTGVPVVLNTSFNDKGEPIVETPENAVKTFMNADMDLLCIGNIVGRKK
jgi:carbamoyltransferase